MDDATGECDPSVVCPDCPLYRTKIGREEPIVTLGVAFAMEHEEEVKSGYRFSDKNALTPLRWSAWRGLLRGRAKFDDWKTNNRNKSDNSHD